MTSLKQLLLPGTRITDAGLASLGKLNELQTLYLAESGITGSGLTHLRNMTSLAYLDLSSTKVDDAALEHLKTMQLKSVTLRNTKVTPEGARSLKTALPKLYVGY